MSAPNYCNFIDKELKRQKQLNPELTDLEYMVRSLDEWNKQHANYAEAIVGYVSNEDDQGEPQNYITNFTLCKNQLCQIISWIFPNRKIKYMIFFSLIFVLLYKKFPKKKLE